VERTGQHLNVANEELQKLVTAAALVVLALPALASPGTAEKAYEAGRYKEAYAEYQRLIGRRPDDARLHFNAGTSAFQDGNLDAATNELSNAIFATDPDLLARAYYNLGNANFRLGEKAGVADEKLADWQRAQASYDSAIKLAPRDEDAKFNRQVVAQRIEELRQQMAQQPPPSGSGQQKDNPGGAKNPGQQQGSQDPGKDPGQPKPQPGGGKDDGQAKGGSGGQRPETKESTPDPAKDRPQPGRQEGGPGEKQNGPLTAEQVRQMLEASKGEEKPWSFRPPPDGKAVERPRRDW